MTTKIIFYLKHMFFKLYNKTIIRHMGQTNSSSNLNRSTSAWLNENTTPNLKMLITINHKYKCHHCFSYIISNN